MVKRAEAPERSTKDTTLHVVTLVALFSSAVIRLSGGPSDVATLLLLLAIVTSGWAAWRWYDREPDGRRGE
ncbi:hypothetical protein BH11ACT8_BH11ACT8_15330 [soil metagenome]